VAAYTLPGAVGAIALRRWLGGRHGAGLVIAVRSSLLILAAPIGIALGLATVAVLAIRTPHQPQIPQ